MAAERGSRRSIDGARLGATHASPRSARPDRIVLVAFLLLVLFAGTNAIGVRLVLREMGPFWSAAIRFAAAGLLLAGYVSATRRPLPRAERLTGTVLFGLFGFGLAYLFLYQALTDAPAGTAMLMLAIVPLLTVLLAAAQGVEHLRLLGLVGAGVAAAGIVVVSVDQMSVAVPALSLGLLVVAAVCQAESAIVVKRFPPGDPVAANAIGMLLGAAMLVAVAVVTREALTLPSRPETWVAMVYLVGPGSIGAFVLVLLVLARWTASAASYGFLLFPFVTVALDVLLLDQPVRGSFILGGVIVLAGVYLGVVYRPPRRVGAVDNEEPMP